VSLTTVGNDNGDDTPTAMMSRCNDPEHWQVQNISRGRHKRERVSCSPTASPAMASNSALFLVRPAFSN